PALAESDWSYVRQHRSIPPHSCPQRFLRVGSDRVSLRSSANRAQLITNVKRSGAFGTQSLRPIGGDGFFATRTFKVADLWHSSTIAAPQTFEQVVAGPFSFGNRSQSRLLCRFRFQIDRPGPFLERFSNTNLLCLFK